MEISMRIAVIGLGNMAKAIIGGMLSKGIAKPEEIVGCAKTAKTREAVGKQYGIGIENENAKAAAQADVLLLAVKPQVLDEVILEIRDAVKPDALIISIAAGKTIAQIEQAFGRKVKLVRCMPNTPAMVGEGCSGVCRNEAVSEQEMAYCLNLFAGMGLAQEIPERLIDAVIGVSGSSPAFVFMFLEALADGAVKAGMPRNQAYQFAAQAVLGSAKLLLESGKHPGELKDMVCSPGGTTIEGVQALEDAGFRSAVMGAVEACVEKSRGM